jgi:hypothetical protein
MFELYKNGIYLTSAIIRNFKIISGKEETMKRIIVFISLFFISAIEGQDSQCPNGFQPYAGRCISQRMADYISCIEATGGNKEQIHEEISSLLEKEADANVNASGGNSVVKGAANFKLDKKAESALVKTIEKRWFNGGTSECTKVLNSSLPPSVSIQKIDSKIEIVDYSVTYTDSLGMLIPKIDIKMRNIGDQVAFIKELKLNILGKATFEDCNQPLYSLAQVSAVYDLNIEGDLKMSISQEIKPNDVDRIILKVGRNIGGPTLTVYKVELLIIYDGENKKAKSKPFFIKLNGPTVWLGASHLGVSEEDWNACVKRNKVNFNKIGYKIYDE